ncbi:MAG: adenylate/guanylate cyclase domain-containing protein [Anaerolineae bacterium]
MTEGSGPKRRLAAILFVDMVGYTALMEESESLALGLVEEIRTVSGERIPRHAGEIVKTIGDGIFAAFGSAVQAVQAALAIQQDLSERNRELRDREPLEVRIGIHLGDLVREGEDLYGTGVNVASRIEPLAPPGGICISGEIYRQVRNQEGLSFEDLGSKPLRNVPDPVHLYLVKTHEGLAADAVKPTAPSVAVLPFENMSPDPENEYFADGMTEEILAHLSKIRALKVAARTSAFRFKGKEVDLREVGRELGVRTVLEGSVRKHADRLRITAQLIDAADGFHLWSDQYDRNLDDVFEIQSEIAQRVAEALEIELLGDEKQAIDEAPTGSLEAYTLYLQGRFFWNKRTVADLERAIEQFEDAIALEPEYALAHTGMADAYVLLERYGGYAPSASLPIAKEAAARAVDLDSTLAEAHASLGLAAMYADWDWDGAERSLRQAIELNPSYPTAHHWLAWVLTALGRQEEAEAEIRLAQRLDPLSLIISANVGTILYFARRYDEADEQLQRTLELEPGFVVAHQWLGRVYEQTGRYEEAIAEHSKAIEALGEDPESIASLGHAYAVAGRADDARPLLEQLDSLSKQRYVSAYWPALVHTGLGDVPQALSWLERAVEERGDWMIFLGAEPMFDPLRREQRFRLLLQQLGVPA